MQRVYFFLAHKVGDVKVEYENSQLLHFLDMKPSECRGWRLTFWHVCVLVDTGDPASNDFPAFLTSKQRHQWYVFAYQYLLTSFMSASCPRFCPPCLLHRSATEIPNLLRWFSHFEGDLPFSLVISFLLLLKPCILDFFGWLFIMVCFANQFFAEQKKTRSLFKLFFPLGTPRMLTFFLPRFLSIRALQCTWWHRRGCCLRRCGRRGVRYQHRGHRWEAPGESALADAAVAGRFPTMGVLPNHPSEMGLIGIVHYNPSILG